MLRATACASEGAAGLALELLDGAGLSTEQQERVLCAYRAGFRAALVSVGIGFGLEPVGPQPKPGQVAPGIAGLLWAEAGRD